MVLDSAEFLDLNTKKWTKTSSLKVGRTEHAMALVYGIPTVIGGICFIFYGCLLAFFLCNIDIKIIKFM